MRSKDYKFSMTESGNLEANGSVRMADHIYGELEIDQET
jgi:hypothetical protein